MRLSLLILTPLLLPRSSQAFTPQGSFVQKVKSQSRSATSRRSMVFGDRGMVMGVELLPVAAGAEIGLALVAGHIPVSTNLSYIGHIEAVHVS
jgi:hypothetical protein